MKTLVVPDIHQRIDNVEWLLENNTYDEVVFLGDFFDSFFEPPKVASFGDTCEYLKYLVLKHPNHSRFRFIVGNHDMNYIYSNVRHISRHRQDRSPYYCSGSTVSKIRRFQKHFVEQGLGDSFFLDNFKLCHRTQGWLLSHAGVVTQHFPYGHSIDTFVEEDCVEAFGYFREFQHPRNYLITDVGTCRGGTSAVGGVTWLDWRVELFPSSDVGKQIVGHTTVKEPDTKGSGDIECWNLDDTRSYGVIENEKLKIYKYYERV